MALVEFYLSQARLCDDAARVSTDPKIIRSLQAEAARFRALASTHGNKRDPYISATEERRHADQEGASDREEGNRTSHKTGPKGSGG